MMMCLFPALLDADEPERGVTRQLARQRKAVLSEVEYDLSLDLQKTGPIHATIRIRFRCQDASQPLVIDFNVPAANVRDVQLGGQTADYRFTNGHIVLPADCLQSGHHEVMVAFTAGNPSLNRSQDFLYTLLVPDRASTVFPCFDQPDLKARFRLTLTLPDGWVASANGALENEQLVEGRRQLAFRQTKPISTYLFSFAAGEFQTVTREVDGRRVTMYHRETDEEKVQRNVDDIFTIHALALNWMEDYTGIDYPFDKFDFVLIPSFQYGGMEHIGNIFYNASGLFLEKSATRNQRLDRAALIAHETAHMWFGNLVTMEWFDDVWLKEVFANFMAAKIVHPGFPDINHDLGFMLKHHPSAYGEDRSGGTYPIQQELDNLRNAGTLYGRIIYMKAPVVMRQLETMMGRGAMQEGLREYLKKYSYDNAVWDDLIDILDRRSHVDLKQWSETWVKEAGTPELESSIVDAGNRQRVLAIRQTRRTPGEKFWSQQVDVKVVADGQVIHQRRVMINGETTEIALPEEVGDYDFCLVNGSELGYGYFRLDPESQAYLLEHVHEVPDEVTRGAAWLALYESLVRGQISPQQYLKTLRAGLAAEQEPLNRQNILGQLATVFWKFLSLPQRREVAADIEAALWKWIDADGLSDEARSSYYQTLVDVAMTDETIQRLLQIWEAESDVNGLPLAETDFMSLAAALALRLPEQSGMILETQLQRLKNEDRAKQFAFVMPALSPDAEIRGKFFESLRDPQNRRPERWALEGLEYLHHPLRAEASERYILPALEMLEEIQITGDIFFPKRWLVATFSGHRSAAAAGIVSDFLADRPDYPLRLKNKILQAADLLLKAGGLPDN
jgi:aminopeptidase N